MKPLANHAETLVVGGGLAGLAAAVRLADAGARPIVIESRRRLGGRAGSFQDPRTGRQLDVGQHVMVGCCTCLTDFYRRLDVFDRIELHREVHLADGRGRIDRIAFPILPGPLHGLPGILRSRTFSVSEKVALARGMQRVLRTLPEEVDGVFFADLLDAWKQPRSLVDRFWNPFVVGVCNAPVDRVSGRYAVLFFRDALLAGPDAASIGVASVPLGALVEPAVRRIEEAGGSVHLGVRATGIASEAERVTAVDTNQGRILIDRVILAVTVEQLRRLTRPLAALQDERFVDLDCFEPSPILGLHLWFDRPVMHVPHLMLVDHDTHWIFNKGLDGDRRQHLQVVISAADAWMSRPREEIVSAVMDDLRAVLPVLRDAPDLPPLDCRVVKERSATFVPAPGIEARRPSATGSIENLFLAGDFCRNGWPSTMEGAVRSGYAAAAACAGDAGFEMPNDHEPGMLFRLLARRRSR
jgi:squalene-associated FAD-dependent desaturase